jgi:hypothetical protein
MRRDLGQISWELRCKNDNEFVESQSTPGQTHAVECVPRGLDVGRGHHRVWRARRDRGVEPTSDSPFSRGVMAVWNGGENKDAARFDRLPCPARRQE